MAGIARRATIEMPIEIDQEKLRSVNSMLNRITKRSSSFTKSFQDASEQLKSFNDRADEFGKNYKDMMEQANSSNREFTRSSKDLSKQSAQSQKDIQKSLSDTRRAQKQLNDTNSSGSSSIDGMSRSHAKLGSNLSSNTSRLKKMDNASHHMIMSGMNMSMTFAAVGAGLWKGGKNALNLQDEYIKVQNLAVNGGEKQAEVQRNMNKIQNQGSSLAQRYGVSQNQISQGYEALIRRGYSTNEALGAQGSLLKASIASGDQYNDVVQNAGDAIDQFGMRTNNATKMAQNTKTATNQMAYAADLTATNFQNMGYGLKYVGATSHTAHQSLSETASAIGVLSNSGQDASVAGTGLRQILNSLISVNTSSRKQSALKQIGLDSSDLKDSHGNLKSLDNLFQIINQHTQGMSGTQRTDIFHQLFGTTGQESASILSKNENQLGKLNKQVSQSQNQHGGSGYTSQLSQKNMQSAQRQLQALQQSVNAFAIGIAQQMLPAATKIMKGISGIAKWLNQLSPTSKKIIGWGSVILTGLGPVELAIGGIGKSITSLIHTYNWLGNKLSRPFSHNSTNSLIGQTGELQAASESGDSSLGSSVGSSYGSGNLTRMSRIHPAEDASVTAKMDRSGFGLANTVGRTGSFTRDAESSSKLLSGVGKIGGLTSVISMALPLLSMLNGKNTGSKMANVGATGLTSMIPFIGPFIAPFVGNSAGKAFNDRDIDSRRKQLQRQMSGTSHRNSNGIGDNQINSEWSQIQLRNNARDDAGNRKMNEKMVSDNRSVYSKMKSQLDDYTNHNQQKSYDNLKTLQKTGALRGKNLNKMVVDSKKSSNKRLSNAKNDLSKLSKVEDQGGRTRQHAMRKAESSISKALANGSSHQKIVLGQLQDSSHKISEKQAGQMIGSSYKSMRKTIDNANKSYHGSVNAANRKYNKVVDAANTERYVNGSISQKQYNDIVGKASKTKNKAISHATDEKNGIVDQANQQHDQVVNAAKRQSTDHLSTLNSETGQALGAWQQFGKELKQVWQSISQKFHKWIQHPFSNTFKGIGKLWNNAKGDGIGQTSKSHQKLLQQANIPKNQWGDYNNVINRESSWDPSKTNPNGGAYGLGQALGSNKTSLMSGKYGKNASNPITQLKWMQAYMKQRYRGNAKNAVRHEATQGWYGNGGWSNSPAIFGEVSGQPEVAINPKRNSADKWIGEAINARAKANSSSKWAKIFRHKSLRQQGQSLSSDIKGMQSKHSNNNQNHPIVVNQTINISGNTNKSTVRNIGQQTKQSIKQVIDEYFGEKNDAIFNS